MLKRYTFLLLICSFLLIGMVKCTKPVEAVAPPTVTPALPTKLVIARAPVPVQITVTQPVLVKTLYTHLLTLPAKPAEVCPLYIKAEYQLSFLQVNKPLVRANVIEGGCNEVVLSNLTPPVRSLDATTLALLKRAVASSITNPDAFGGGYRPVDLQSAYNLPSSTQGSGQTVALVDAYNDPYAESDMGVYRAAFGLPVCSTGNGCFKKVNQSGGDTFPHPNVGWSAEIALDLDMVSAVCPLCHILLVEANTPRIDDLGKSVDTAVTLGAHIVSNSYGSPEDTTTLANAHYWTHPGTIITASSGDSGYGVQVPAAYGGDVTAVGGTTLTRSQNARGWQETAWSGSGSGCSSYVSKPIWQWDNGCNNRSVVDVAAVADPATGVAVYDSYGSPGWGVYGGTSAAAPIIAGVYALAGNAFSTTNETLYQHTDELNGVVSGSNGMCVQTYLCTAGPGYNGPTGLGTPNGVGAF